MSSKLYIHLAKDPLIRKILFKSLLKLLVLLALAFAGSTLARYFINKEEVFSFGAERIGFVVAVFAAWIMDVVKTFRTVINEQQWEQQE